MWESINVIHWIGSHDDYTFTGQNTLEKFLTTKNCFLTQKPKKKKEKKKNYHKRGNFQLFIHYEETKQEKQYDVLP